MCPYPPRAEPWRNSAVSGASSNDPIVARLSYLLTPLAEMPRLLRRRWRTRDCLSSRAPRRVGDVSPIPPERFLRVLWPAALADPDRAALSTRSDGVSGRPPTL